MRLREAGGELSRAETAEIYVVFAPGERGGMWLPVPKTIAREVLDAAREMGNEEVDAEVVGNVLRIGVEHDLEDEEDDPVGPVCSGCGDDWAEGHECAEDD